MNASEFRDDADLPDDEAPLVLPARRRPRWGILTALVAWLIIAAIIAVNLIVSRRTALQPEPDSQPRADALFDMQARFMVAQAQMQGANKATLLQQLPALEKADVPARRFKVAILAGELGGPKPALELLTPTKTDAERILVRLFADYEQKRWDAPSLTPRERDLLKRELGWYGELALAPAATPDQAARKQALRPAWRTLTLVIGFVVGGLALAVVGGIGLVILAACWWLGWVRSSIRAGSGPVAVWVETFVLFMLILVGLSFAFSYLTPPFHRAALAGAASLLTLSALCWPRVRGIPWSETRRAIGLTMGRGLLREIAAGVATYVMMLPLMALGLIVTLVLMALVRKLAPGDVETPSHPAVPLLAEGDWTSRVLILILAVVIAPLVEEIMFRGLLYRHMRETTGRFGGVLSFLASTTIVSFVFAAIHPQGWLGIPPLMAIAFGLNLSREWRGTLIPAMVAHGINNALAMSLLLVLLE